VAEVVEGKRVTWAEGFFDLVFVLAITEVATLLGEHHQWWGLGRAFVVLALVYRTWVTTSLQTNRLSRDSTRDRIILFGVGLCGVGMAIAIPHAYDSGGMQFALAYWVARILLWLRYVPKQRPQLGTSLGLSVTVFAPMLVIGALLPDTWREVVWFVTALADLGTITLLGRMHRFIHYDHSHLMERFGLFVLIALGEQIVDLSLPLARQADNIRPLELLAVAVCFVVVCTLWWTYFDQSNAAIISALQGSREHVVLARHLAYGHFGVVGGIVCMAVGFEQMVTKPIVSMTFTHLNLLYGGSILMLTSMIYMRFAMSRVWRVVRLITVAVLLGLLYVSLLIPGIVATALLAAAMFAMVTVEKRWPAFATRGAELTASES
jgi:low temperature requirement protein LtrA